MGRRLPNLVGYRVVGRHGPLGTVVEDDRAPEESRQEMIVFRGGISDALLFRLPTSRVRRISRSSHTVTVEADVGDFAPRLGQDGTVELDLSR